MSPPGAVGSISCFETTDMRVGYEAILAAMKHLRQQTGPDDFPDFPDVQQQFEQEFGQPSEALLRDGLRKAYRHVAEGI